MDFYCFVTVFVLVSGENVNLELPENANELFQFVKNLILSQIFFFLMYKTIARLTKYHIH
jgi:hypothetical protein